MQRRQFLAATASTALFAGCGGNGERSGGGSVDDESSSDGPLKILNHEPFSSEYGNVGVRGTAQNVSERTITYAQIEVYFYDDGARIGSGLANINNLAPGRRWEWEALYMGTDGERITEYDLSHSP